MRALVCAAVALVVLLSGRQALAITYDEIPPDVKHTLHESTLTMFDPEVLSYLTVEDLREYARAYEVGEMRFIADVRVEQAEGPLEPELALLILQIPKGAPFVETRFIRLAKQAYGNGIFSHLEWAVYENLDGSVDMQLWYKSRRSRILSPDITYYSLPGWLIGFRYEDFLVDGEDKRLVFGAQDGERYPDEPRLHFSWTDNTINGGRNAYAVNAHIYSDWRSRLRGGANQADIRQRIARLDGSYSWRGVDLDGMSGTLSVGTGIYDQHHFVYAGDPTQGGTAPRSDVAQEGTASFASLSWIDAQGDLLFTPRDGHYYSVSAAKHFGDVDFERLALDLRQYIPVANLLGHSTPPAGDGARHDIREQFPQASLALQAQAISATGDVPYSYEIRMGGSNVQRGIPSDSYVGTKLLAGRVEYRFNLNRKGDHELFVFSDHAAMGESFDDLEAFHGCGLGGLFRIPIYGGVKVGAYYGRSYNGEDDSYGLTFGYQF